MLICTTSRVSNNSLWTMLVYNASRGQQCQLVGDAHVRSVQGQLMKLVVLVSY
jgi:hypothetical protein